MEEVKLLRLEVFGIWFTGVATIVAVVVALFLQMIMEYFRRPTLCIGHKNDQEPDKRYLAPHLARTLDCPDREEVWLRLMVKNESGRTPATDVELRFIGIRREGDNEQHQRPSWWFKVSNLNDYRVTVPPKFPQYFDIAYLRKDLDKSDLAFYLPIIRRELRSWPEEKARIEAEEDNKLEVGYKYELFFAVVSANSDATFYSAEIRALPLIGGVAHAHALGEVALKSHVLMSSIKKINSEDAFSIPATVGGDTTPRSYPNHH